MLPRNRARGAFRSPPPRKGPTADGLTQRFFSSGITPPLFLSFSRKNEFQKMTVRRGLNAYAASSLDTCTGYFGFHSRAIFCASPLCAEVASAPVVGGIASIVGTRDAGRQ